METMILNIVFEIIFIFSRQFNSRIFRYFFLRTFLLDSYRKKKEEKRTNIELMFALKNDYFLLRMISRDTKIPKTPAVNRGLAVGTACGSQSPSSASVP